MSGTLVGQIFGFAGVNWGQVVPWSAHVCFQLPAGSASSGDHSWCCENIGLGYDAMIVGVKETSFNNAACLKVFEGF